MGLSAPCFGCKDRILKCHDVCKKYMEFKSTNAEIEAARKEYKTGISISAESVARGNKKY